MNEREREGKRRKGFLRRTSPSGHQWPAIATACGEAGNPIYTSLPTFSSTTSNNIALNCNMGNNIHRSSDHQALQETTLTTLGVVRMARIQGVVRKARTASQQKGSVVFRTRAHSCGKIYILCNICRCDITYMCKMEVLSVPRHQPFNKFV